MKTSLLISPIILATLYYSFLFENKEHPKFIYSIPSLIIPIKETSSLKVGDTTFIYEKKKPTLIDIIEEKVNDVPFNPNQKVVRKLQGTNEVPINDPDDWTYPQTNSLPMSIASSPGTYANSYYLPRPMPTPAPASAGSFQ